MDLTQIEALLESPNPQARMRAITELRHYEPAEVVPLLKRSVNDKEFLVRSFAAMGLGYKRNDEAFDALLDVVEYETDHNVIAEAANSLSKFGVKSLSHLVEIFEHHPHWLIRQSILAALEDLHCPEVRLKLCRIGFEGDDPIVKQAAIACLTKLKDTPQMQGALGILTQAAIANDANLRAAAVRVLRHFNTDEAQAALAELRQDSDHRVIAAVLEGLL